MRLAIALVALTGFAFACGGSPKPKAMEADAPLPSEVDDPDAMAAAFSSDTDQADAGVASSADSGAPASGTALGGGEDGARALLAQFVAPDADPVALTRGLRPTSADYKAMFDAATADKVEAAQAKGWDSGKAAIKPAAGQTDVKLASATGAELASGKGAAKEFPREYRKFGKHLSATVTYFRFKFTKPGEDTGTAYDGLAFVNGHWVIAPKPYRAVSGQSSLDDPDDDAAPKKKPKKKKKKAAPP